jgi:hypothetical protein
LKQAKRCLHSSDHAVLTAAVYSAQPASYLVTTAQTTIKRLLYLCLLTFASGLLPGLQQA